MKHSLHMPAESCIFLEDRKVNSYGQQYGKTELKKNNSIFILIYFFFLTVLISIYKRIDFCWKWRRPLWVSLLQK